MKAELDPSAAEDSRGSAIYWAIVTTLRRCRTEWARARRPPGGPRARDADAERLLGLGEKWFSRISTGKIVLSLRHLLAYLRLFELEPGAFFRRALPQAPGDRTRELAEQLRKAAGTEHRRLRARYLGPLRLDDTSYQAGRHALEPLEDLKKEDPRAALRALRALAARAAGEDSRLLGHTLGMLAVTYHGLLSSREAAACAALALELADATGSHLLRADALIRGSTLIADQGEHAVAADLMLEALVSAELAGDQDAVGRALFRRGMFLHYSGNPSAALPLYQRAEKLKATEHGRFAALQAIGVAALDLGDTDLAINQLAAAAALNVPRAARGFALWLGAETAVAAGRFDEAARAYGEARSLLDLSHPADWVLVAIQQSRALLRAGRTGEAPATLRDAAPIAEALTDDGVAGAVKTELLVAAAEGTAAIDRLARLAARVRAASPLASRSTRTD